MSRKSSTDVLAEFGWMCTDIFDGTPPFAYTSGLSRSSDHPELIVFGLDSRTRHVLCSLIVERIQAGQRFTEDAVHDDLLEQYPLAIRAVHRSQHAAYLADAISLCTREELELDAVQIFWPDVDGRFPDQQGCAPEVAEAQPRLQGPISAAELAGFFARHGD